MAHRRLDPNDPILQDPAYPHGEVRGYRRGCSCHPCRRANAADSAKRDPSRKHKPHRDARGVLDVPPPEFREHLLRLLHQSTPQAVAKAADVNAATLRAVLRDPDKRISEITVQRVMAVTPRQVRARRGRLAAEPCIRHIAALCEQVPGANPASVARAAGLTREEVQRVYSGQRAYVLPDTALAIMGVTVEQVRERVLMVPVKRTMQQIRSLQAQDWPVRELARRLGYTTTGLPFLYGYEMVTVDLANRVDALAREIGDRRGDCPRAGRWARKIGWYPAICYDENGDLIPGSVRDDVADKRSAAAEAEARRFRNYLRTVALSAAGLLNAEVAEIVGCGRKDVERRRCAVRADNGIGMVGCPDPEALHALIDEAAEGIDIRERADIFDADVDYKARWETLMDAAWRMRDAAADVA